ncbi:MAG: hypothetical protein GY862_08915, partial [Gammaproteobacteria bacterium]|nr:hypothetical protein [Gammaproteobacteria bacterium]
NFINDTYNLDNTCHNADYALFRLTLVNIIHHAMVRYDAAKPKDSRSRPESRLSAGVCPSKSEAG